MKTIPSPIPYFFIGLATPAVIVLCLISLFHS